MPVQHGHQDCGQNRQQDNRHGHPQHIFGFVLEKVFGQFTQRKLPSQDLGTDTLKITFQGRAADTLPCCGNSNTIWCSLQDFVEIKVVMVWAVFLFVSLYEKGDLNSPLIVQNLGG